MKAVIGAPRDTLGSAKLEAARWKWVTNDHHHHHEGNSRNRPNITLDNGDVP